MNKYWQSFGEKTNSDAYQQSAKDEFREELNIPFEDTKSIGNAATPRRDFLKYLGFSTAAAALAASCEIPVRKAIPFANKPEDIVPGKANYYATTYIQDGDAISILAKVRDGRPIKIEGNELSPVTKGGTSARAQASVLDLYDTARFRFPTIDKKEVTLEAIDREIAREITGLGGAPIVLLTSTIVSPSTKDIIAKFLVKYPGSRHVQYDAVSYSGLLLANEATYGKRAIPSYRFDNAKVVVSIGADFLNTWLSPVEFTKQYTPGRTINEKAPEMSKHYQFESVLSPTGASADERFLCRPSEWGAIAAALLSAVNGQAVSGVNDKLKANVQKVAKELTDNKGKALVICGSNDPNIQIVVNALNEALQANGKTIDWSTTANYKQGVDADFAKLVEDLNAGAVGGLIIHGANPAYSWYDSKKFVDGLKRTKFTVSFSGKNDETTQLVKYVLPDNHYLESWGDAEPKSGYISFIQPTINPLFKTRQWQDSLLKWAGETIDYTTYLKQYWVAKTGSESNWLKVIQDGVLNPATKPAVAAAVFNAGAVANAATAVSNIKKGGKFELVLYQNIGIGEGQGASNPFLQELPDPITRATWDNYVIVSPALARTLLNIDLNVSGQADAYEVNPAKKVVKVKANGKEISLPALIIPGTDPNTIGIAVGYGRTEQIGLAAKGVGRNAYPLASLNGNAIEFTNADVTIELTGEMYDIAVIQTHGRYDTPQGNRTEVLKELTFADYKKDPTEILDDREEELKPFGGTKNFVAQGTIYPVFDKPGVKWGMSIDLNACTGCGACVVACNIENNVPIVGKHEVQRFHDMHWLRIDRYYSGDADNPNVTFQPMLCQHCDNAPCENVCPVNATNHSTEGLNQMAYNRCIGTRYCANNCPFKVRRFNWADYTGADSFPDNQKGVVSDVSIMMGDELSRMVLNPDVTIRSRGVMEKCSFCVQRLQEGKLKAKRESRPLITETTDKAPVDVQTACQQACPSDCFVFGNVNDKNSDISKARANNQNRLFYALEMLHVLPNVNYLAKVRNVEEA